MKKTDYKQPTWYQRLLCYVNKTESEGCILKGKEMVDGGHQKKISSVGIYLLIGPMLVVQKFQLTKYTNSHPWNRNHLYITFLVCNLFHLFAFILGNRISSFQEDRQEEYF